MIVTGTVYKITGNYVHIKTPRPTACENCSNYALCSGKDVKMQVLNTVSAKIGDSVEVSVNEDNRIIYIMSYLFLLPIAVIFAGYGLYTISPFALLILIPIIFFYFFGLYYINKKFNFKAETIRIIDSSETECIQCENKSKLKDC